MDVPPSCQPGDRLAAAQLPGLRLWQANPAIKRHHLVSPSLRRKKRRQIYKNSVFYAVMRKKASLFTSQFMASQPRHKTPLFRCVSPSLRRKKKPENVEKLRILRRHAQ